MENIKETQADFFFFADLEFSMHFDFTLLLETLLPSDKFGRGRQEQ